MPAPAARPPYRAIVRRWLARLTRGGGGDGRPDGALLARDLPALRRGDPSTLTFVTVVYEEELGLLLLQARSLSMFMEPATLARVVVIVNGPHQRAVADRIRNTVLPEYGALARRVQLLSARDVVPDLRVDAGWFTQQVLKLAIADRVTTDYYVALDAKNHFLRPASSSSFFWDDGRARYQPHRHLGTAMERHFINSLEFFGNAAARESDTALPTTTPFVFHAAAARLLQREVRRRGRTLSSLLIHDAPRSEFLLYYSFLLMVGAVEDLYSPDRARTVTLWKGNVEDAREFSAALDRLESDPDYVVFSVHRQARTVLTHAQRQRITALWASRGLVVDPVEADRLLRPDPPWTT